MPCPETEAWRKVRGKIKRDRGTESWRESSKFSRYRCFYDEAIAAPSMKAALDAWGAKSNLFHQGMAKESSDPEVVAAAMSKPGVLLRRAVGSSDPFREHAELPTNLIKVENRAKTTFERKETFCRNNGRQDNARGSSRT
jgi:hypothetical protein